MKHAYALFAVNFWSRLALAAPSAGLSKLSESIQDWVGGLTMVGLGLASGIIVCAYLFKIRFFQNLADEYQKSLFWMVGITATASYFQAEIADFLSRVSNPFGLGGG